MNKIKIIAALALTVLASGAAAQYSQLGNQAEFMFKAEAGYQIFTGNSGQAGEHGFYLSKFYQAAGINLIAGANLSQDWFVGAGAGLNYYHSPQQKLAEPMTGINFFADIDFRPIWKGTMGIDYQPSSIKWAPMVGARLGGSMLMGPDEPQGYGTTITPLAEFYGGVNWYYRHGLRNMERNWHSFYATIGIAYMQQTLFLPVRVGWRW